MGFMAQKVFQEGFPKLIRGWKANFGKLYRKLERKVALWNWKSGKDQDGRTMRKVSKLQQIITGDNA